MWIRIEMAPLDPIRIGNTDPELDPDPDLDPGQLKW